MINKVGKILLASSVALLGVVVLPAADAAPAIEIADVPPYGVDGFVNGSVTGVDPSAYKVAPFIHIEGVGWWTKPTFTEPAVAIASDGSFSADVANGGLDNRATIYCVYLVAESAIVPLAAGDVRVPAAMTNLTVASTCSERYARTVDFSGFSWGVKEAPVPVGPGGNRFSERSEDVYVDDEGRLHMWLRFRDGFWWASEVILMQTHGFGTYSFTTESDVDGLDRNIVFGAFLWDPHGDDSSLPAGASNREIDSEDSRWGNRFDPNGAQWAIAPFFPAGNIHRYALPDLGSPPYLSRSIDWSADKIEFNALAGQHTPCDQAAADLIDNYVYLHNPSLNQYVPSAGRERFRFNLWLTDAAGPNDGQETEVVITNMTFYPSGDSDCDSVAQASDNCSVVANPDQSDTDGDGIGNSCDADLDNNCAINFLDLGLLKSVFFTSDADADFNGDGVVNFLDLGVMKSGFFAPPGPSGLTNNCSP